VHRPGIAIVTPTPSGPVAVCDVGANVNCRPQHLHQYGVMAGLFLKATYGVENSRVGLLSVGEEDAKGNELVKRTRQLLKDDTNVNFVGNVEGRDLFRGVCDVMVCEGFVGNVILKLIEGMAEVVVRSMVDEVRKMLPPGAEGMVKGAVGGMLSKYDFNEYGGAPLLGVGGICIICHGASSHRGIMNAVRGAISFSRHGVNEQITLQLSEGSK
jgi:glycerol-3-phosphate acyltransferase PlsX